MSDIIETARGAFHVEQLIRLVRYKLFYGKFVGQSEMIIQIKSKDAYL